MAVTGPPRRIGQAQRKNPPGSESNRLAATGAVLLFGGAVIMRLRRGERATIIADLVYLAMAAFVAWGRFGPGSFTRLTQRAAISRARQRRIARGGLPDRGRLVP
jgi:hypothetical protein